MYKSHLYDDIIYVPCSELASVFCSSYDTYSLMTIRLSVSFVFALAAHNVSSWGSPYQLFFSEILGNFLYCRLYFTFNIHVHCVYLTIPVSETCNHRVLAKPLPFKNANSLLLLTTLLCALPLPVYSCHDPSPYLRNNICTCMKLFS